MAVDISILEKKRLYLIHFLNGDGAHHIRCAMQCKGGL